MIAAEYSTIGPIGTLIAQTIEAAGQDPEAIFAEVGLDLQAMRDPNVRMSSESLQALLLLAQERCNDPIFGLRLANFIHPSSFHSLGIALCFCETFGDFLDRFIKYYRLITNNDALDAKIEGSEYQLIATPRPDMPLIPIRVDGFASLTVSTIRVALGTDFNPLSVALARPQPAGVEAKYTDYFGCPVQFDAPLTMIAINADDLAQKLPTANPELMHLYEQLTIDCLAKLDRADFPARVQKELLRLLPAGISGKEQVSEALNISPRTLYNKLESAGTTYREVLDETRRSLAEEYIRRDIPIYEIAYSIGFSDTANFSRAFKNWTGQSPMEYREICAA